MTRTQTEVPVKKVTLRGESRVAFIGSGTFRLPDVQGREIVEEATQRYDIDTLDDNTTLATMTVATDPEHRLIDIEWCDLD